MEDKNKYAAQARYQAKTRKRLPINLNTKTDQDIITHLEKIDNLNGYVKDLIRADMARSMPKK